VLSALFKSVCGALLRGPGWVRFPSIPAIAPEAAFAYDFNRMYVSKRWIVALIAAFVVFPVAWVVVIAPALLVLLHGASG
jgi:hypothetical protein